MRIAEEAKGHADFVLASTMQEQAGFCNFKAAYQADNYADFPKLIEAAKSAYRVAIELNEKATRPLSVARITLLKGLSSFVGSFVSENLDMKARRLRESSETIREAQELFQKLGDKGDVREASLSLLESLVQELNIEWSTKRRREIVEEAIRIGRKLIQDEPASTDQIAWAYYRLGFFIWQRVYLQPEPSIRDQDLSDGQEFNKKATELSTRAHDHFLTAKANLAAISMAGVRGSPELFKQHLKNAVDSALLTKDNEVIAEAILAKAYDLLWEMASKELPETRMVDFEQCRRLTEEALTRYKRVLNDEGVASCYALGLAQAYNRLAFAEVNQVKRASLLDEAAKYGRAALEIFRGAGCAGDESPAHHLMIILYHIASSKTDVDEKRSLLNEGVQMVAEELRHRESTTPYHSWNRGVALYYRAIMEAELARIDPDPEKRVPMLRNASRGVDEAIGLCKQHFGTTHKIRPNVAVGLGTYSSKLSSILEEIYVENKETLVHDEFLSALREAADFYGQGGWPSRAAEAYWKQAQSLDRQRRYSKASEAFGSASTLYEAAAEKTPEFGEYFRDYASYMKAWEEIERAKHQRTLQTHDDSSVSFSRASELLKGAKRWNRLADHFSAWAHLEAAEEFSEKERFFEAIEGFAKARELFAQNETMPEGGTWLPPGAQDEFQITLVSSVRKDYCEARIALERARLHDFEDDESKAALQYGVAGNLYDKIAQTDQSTSDRREMKSMSLLCRGWQLMREGEGSPSSTLYTEASEIFAEAAGSGVGDKIESVASANSQLCQAMNFELEFAKTGNLAMYSQAKTHFQVARKLFLGLDLERLARWAEATMTILDAGLYALKAESALDSAERAKLYASAKKSLEFAVAISERAGHKSRTALIKRELDHIKERAQVAVDLAQVMTTPPISSPGNLVESPTMEAKGLAAFEGVNIQARLRHESEIEVGEMLQLQLDLYNTGKKPASLLRIEGVSPRGFKPITIPEPYVLEETTLNAKGRVVGPLRIESFVLSLKAEEIGETTLNPRLVYVDEAGRLTFQSLEATTVKTLPEPVFEFKKEEGKAVFECLVEAFVQDYMRKRLSSEQSGWRSLIEIADLAGLPRSSLYGKEGRHGPVIFELLSRGLIETRTFSGQRGRGGEVLRARITYTRDSIKRYVDRRIMKPK